jgi:hypothetical protein
MSFLGSMTLGAKSCLNLARFSGQAGTFKCRRSQSLLHYFSARTSLLFLCWISLFSARSKAQVPSTILDQMSTEDHLKQPGWWPRKGEAARDEYVGPAVCAECHETQAHGQGQHSMAHTAMVPTDSPVLKDSEAKFQIGPYSYKISRVGDREIYTVANGGNSVSIPLIWAFGSGSRGQSYLFRYEGKLYEGRISFFHDRGFNITPDHPETPSASLPLALGRQIPNDEEVKCFGCHTVASTTKGHFDASQLMPGISCEGCHGPGAAHVALARSGTTVPGLIYNPGRLSSVQSVDFCGACHRTWWDVSYLTDIRTVRFPALRLEKSKCWGNGDKRLTCAACHNPHQPLQRESTAYDAKCLSCHQAKSAGPAHTLTNVTVAANEQPSAPACRTGTSNCVSCHMPKFEIPSMRNLFTDHKIQIVTSKSFVQ